MRAGTILRRFEARDGREVILRAPRWDDLDNMLEFINSLIEEGADITMDTKTTRENEVEWLSRLLTKVENDKVAVVVAEVDGRFVGQTEVTPKGGRMRHVGVLGIAIRDGYRDMGVGTELMREVEPLAKKLEIEIMTLEVFASNERARHVYEKAGYKEMGRLPRGARREDGYTDTISMYKEI